MKALDEYILMQCSCCCWVEFNLENVQLQNCQMKSKGVTTQMKALNEYIVIVFTLLLSGVQPRKRPTLEMSNETFNEYILIAVYTLLLNGVHFVCIHASKRAWKLASKLV